MTNPTPTLAPIPYPDLKGTDRVVADCGRCGGTGVYSGPSNASWEVRGKGKTTWCFDCNGEGKTSVLVSSVRARVRRQALAAEKAAAEAEAARVRRAAWVAAGHDVLLAEAERFIWEQVRANDPLRQPLADATARLNLFTATAEDAQAVRDAMAAFEARRNAPSTIPTGRVQVRGTVLTIRRQESAYGVAYRMLVDSGEGWKVWGTVPGAIAPSRGDVVEFTAQVTASAEDPSFGYYSRPTKAAIVEAAEVGA